MNLVQYEINEDYYLFFSADIVDSTQKKYESTNWPIIFAEHFKCFVDILENNCSSLKTETGEIVKLSPLNLWKINGDELLFYISINKSFLSVKKNSRIKHRYELALWYVKTFIETIKEFNKVNNLAVKGTIWAGNTPVGNCTITYKKFNVDFIGKSIDIGFRLAKYSSTDKVTISIELAIILMRDNLSTLKRNNIKIIYESSEALKGVLKGMKYPLCWINMNNELTNMELKLNGKINQCMEDIAQFLEEIIKTSNNQLHYPYIPKTPLNEPFSIKWDGYEEELNMIVERIKEKSRITCR